jgi:hypothetical protein
VVAAKSRRTGRMERRFTAMQEHAVPGRCIFRTGRCCRGAESGSGGHCRHWAQRLEGDTPISPR